MLSEEAYRARGGTELVTQGALAEKRLPGHKGALDSFSGAGQGKSEEQELEERPCRKEGGEVKVSMFTWFCSLSWLLH